ncbi:MAG: hypothetical protein BGO69_07675 [Bacteroidetes bacterium 46-16]|nr:MAG: hypothetical protein BGO69_07675 [Bacteroidetes bacterium 46-16]
MKYSIRILCIFYYITPIFCHAQTDTTFLNSEWKETDKVNANYYRLRTKLGDRQYVVEDHYLDGQIQMRGHYSQFVPANEDSIGNPAHNGIFVYYDNYSNTKTAEGELSLGKKTGRWKDYFVNSEYLKAEYEFNDGQLDGKAVYYDSLTHKVMLEGYYTANKQTGKWKTYYVPSGKLAKKFFFGDGEAIGSAKYFYESGELMAEGKCNEHTGREGEWTYYDKYAFVTKTETFLHDTLDGRCRKYKVWFSSRSYANCLWQEYYYKQGVLCDTVKVFDINTGKLKYSAVMKDGKLDGAYSLYNQNHLEKTGNFKDSLRMGTWKEFYPGTDKIQSEANYTNGKLDGIMTTFDKDGHKKSELHYEKGWQSGTQKKYYGNGKLKSVETWDYNEPEGPAIYYDSVTGQPNRELTYFTDKTNLMELNGYCANYYEPGIIKTEGILMYGEKNGEWKFYDEYGRLSSIKYFERGLLSGSFIQYYTRTGKKAVEGYFVNNKREGLFKYYFKNSDSLSCLERYRNDSMEGHFVYYHEPGIIKSKGDYKANVREGKWEFYYYNGQMKSTEYYKGGIKNGPARYYDSVSGNLIESGNYLNDSADGEWIFQQTVEPIRSVIVHFTNGQANGSLIVYDANKRPILKGNYNHDKKDGLWAGYYPQSNQILIQANFKNDILTGDMDIYYPNSKKMISQTYDSDGQKTSEKYFDENNRPLEQPDLKMRLTIDKEMKGLAGYILNTPE